MCWKMTPDIKLELEHACPQVYLHFHTRVVAHMHTHVHTYTQKQVHTHENVKSSPKSDQDRAGSEQCGMLENNCGSTGHVNPKSTVIKEYFNGFPLQHGFSAVRGQAKFAMKINPVSLPASRLPCRLQGCSRSHRVMLPGSC